MAPVRRSHRLRGSHPLRPSVPVTFGSVQHPSETAAAISPSLVQPRTGIAGRLCHHCGLGSSPFARRYSGNPLFSSGYSDVSLPPVPPWLSPGARPCVGRVAPFGHLRIAGRQRLPGAFRRVAASFFGRQRLGIHHAPFSRSPTKVRSTPPLSGQPLDRRAPAGDESPRSPAVTHQPRLPGHMRPYQTWPNHPPRPRRDPTSREMPTRIASYRSRGSRHGTATRYPLAGAVSYVDVDVFVQCARAGGREARQDRVSPVPRPRP